MGQLAVRGTSSGQFLVLVLTDRQLAGDLGSPPPSEPWSVICKMGWVTPTASASDK